MKVYLLKKHIFAAIVCSLSILVANPTTVMANGSGTEGNGMNQGGQRGSGMDSDNGRRGQGMRYEGRDSTVPGGGQGRGLGGNEGRGPGGGQGGGQRGHESGRR